MLEIRQELKRSDKKALEVLEARKRSTVYFVFPETKEDCKTSLVLKAPKTESSVRTVYLPNTVAVELLKLKKPSRRKRNVCMGCIRISTW